MAPKRRVSFQKNGVPDVKNRQGLSSVAEIARKHGPGQSEISSLCVEMSYPNTTHADSRVFGVCRTVSTIALSPKSAQLPESVVTL
jgi:hypothetical protein